MRNIYLDRDTESISSKFKCILGINKNTGRLQWCPGSRCAIMTLLISIIVVPIILILLLLPQIKANYESNSVPTNLKLNTPFEDSTRDPRCVAVKLSLSETYDIEDKQILKDVRTSFIPNDVVILPPNCRNSDAEWSNSQTNYNSNVDYINNDNEDDYYVDEFREYVLRRRRDSELLITPRNGTNNLLNVELIPNDNIDRIVHNIGTDKTQENSHQLIYDGQEEESDPVSVGDESASEASFHAFWKGEGSPDQIRSAQVQAMKQYMDLSADPCQDYYQYACGNWEKLNPIPQDKVAYDTFEMLRENLDSVLNELLSSPEANKLNSASKNIQNLTNSNALLTPDAAVNPTVPVSQSTLINKLIKSNTLIEVPIFKQRILSRRSILTSILNNYSNRKYLQRYRRELISKENEINIAEAEMKAKNLYKSCMDYELLEKRGIQPLMDLLDSLGGWPVLDSNWREVNFDWINLTANLRLYNNDIFIVEWVGADIKNSDEYIIQFDQTSLGLPSRDYFLLHGNRHYLDAYKSYMTEVIILLGASKHLAAQTANEIVAFETELAKITSAPEERTNVSVLYRRMQLGLLHEQIPQIDWQRYLSIVLERQVNATEDIVMFAFKYMQDLVTLISKTETKTISNYLLWRFVRHRVNNLDDRFQEAKQKFFYVLFGREKSPPRWKNCVNQVNSNMGMAVGAMFVRKYFDENSKMDTLEMTQELQESFREILNESDWLDPQTKQLAELKVNAMSLRIGYPDYILIHKELNAKYKELEIDPTKYFENTLNVLKHLTKSEQSKLGEMVNKTAWHTAPAIVNAYYSRNKNQIMFPAGILQPPFYHRYFPRSLNYGGIGVVIGHELTHGFDDKGRLFDREGNLHRWWTESAINSFHDKARCLIAQYGNYTVSEVGIPVDGESTQGENIADNGGIKQAFRAYKKWLEDHSTPKILKDEILPGINATNTQLFFLNFAQVWCGAMRPEATRNKLKTAVHSPGRFRVLGTLSNSEDFAKEYNCPLGSPMNPENKCSVW